MSSSSKFAKFAQCIMVPTPLCLHFLRYKSLQKVFFDHLPPSSCKHNLWTAPYALFRISNKNRNMIISPRKLNLKLFFRFMYQSLIFHPSNVWFTLLKVQILSPPSIFCVPHLSHLQGPNHFIKLMLKL